jgi:D-aminopeptidase
MGMARTGASGANGSGDYAIAFSTAPELRVRPGDEKKARRVTVLGNEAMSPLFLAAIEATEEAIYNSLLKATTVTGRGRTVEAIPVERVVEILRAHGMVKK